MTTNPVLESTKILIENPEYVFINNQKIEQLAKKWSKLNLKRTSWNNPVFPKENSKETIDFFFLINTINFAFTDFKTKNKFITTYKEKEWRGAYGMIASVKRAIEEGIPILNSQYLENITLNNMKHIFRGNIEIPMIQERTEIFREVGTVLSKNYQGHFYNLVENSNNKLFNNGSGIVESLINNFSSFDDSINYKGKMVRFDKRAQLAVAMTYGKFDNQEPFHVKDIDKITVFADYVLPKGLRNLGILNYSKELSKKVDTRQLIEEGSLEELEIRASTIHAAQRLQDEINKYRLTKPINATHIDYKLWSETRGTKGFSHLTKTINY